MRARPQEDPSGDTYGDLDFDEFVDLYNALSPKAKKETKIQTAFRLYDSNMDGYLDPMDLKQLLRVRRPSTNHGPRSRRAGSRTHANKLCDR